MPDMTAIFSSLVDVHRRCCFVSPEGVEWNHYFLNHIYTANLCRTSRSLGYWFQISPQKCIGFPILFFATKWKRGLRQTLAAVAFCLRAKWWVFYFYCWSCWPQCCRYTCRNIHHLLPYKAVFSSHLTLMSLTWLIRYFLSKISLFILNKT